MVYITSFLLQFEQSNIYFNKIRLGFKTTHRLSPKQQLTVFQAKLIKILFQGSDIL